MVLAVTFLPRPVKQAISVLSISAKAWLLPSPLSIACPTVLDLFSTAYKYFIISLTNFFPARKCIFVENLHEWGLLNDPGGA
jgi:hypothetical protein